MALLEDSGDTQQLKTRWTTMGYPMKKDIKIKLIFLYYEILCEWSLLPVDRSADAHSQSSRGFPFRSSKTRAISSSA